MTKPAPQTDSRLKAVTEGVSIRTSAENPVLKTASYDLSIPVTIGNTGTPWILGLSAPIDAVLAETERHGLVATGALAVTAVLVAIVAVYPLPAMVLVPLLAGVGFLSGIIAPSRDMLVRAASPKGAEGRVFGIVSTGFNIGGAAGPVLFGWLLDNGHPHAIFWSAVIFMLITAAV